MTLCLLVNRFDSPPLPYVRLSLPLDETWWNYFFFLPRVSRETTTWHTKPAKTNEYSNPTRTLRFLSGRTVFEGRGSDYCAFGAYTLSDGHSAGVLVTVDLQMLTRVKAAHKTNAPCPKRWCRGGVCDALFSPGIFGLRQHPFHRLSHIHTSLRINHWPHSKMFHFSCLFIYLKGMNQ